MLTIIQLCNSTMQFNYAIQLRKYINHYFFIYFYIIKKHEKWNTNCLNKFVININCHDV